jgi:hypothetical protein
MIPRVYIVTLSYTVDVDLDQGRVFPFCQCILWKEVIAPEPRVGLSELCSTSVRAEHLHKLEFSMGDLFLLPYLFNPLY